MSAHPVPYYQVDVTLDLAPDPPHTFTVTRFTPEEIVKVVNSYNAMGQTVENYRECTEPLLFTPSDELEYEAAIDRFADGLKREFPFLNASDTSWRESGKNLLMRLGLEWKWD